jgi:hypothetical protein
MTSAYPWRYLAMALIAFGCFGQVCSQAQGQAHDRTHDRTHRHTTHTLFAEAFGTAGLGSVNYELALDPVVVRGGLGYMFFWPSYPLTVSYRFGRDAARLDVGGGVVFFGRADLGDEPGQNRIEEMLEARSSIGCGVAAMRYELPHSPLTLRASVTAFAARKVVVWPGAGLGFRIRH